MNWTVALIALACTTFTGWLVAWLATRIIFHPRKPIHIAGITLLGAYPKNRERIAAAAGQIATDAFSFTTIENKITDPALFENLKPEIEKHIDVFLREKLKLSFPMISMFIGDKTINQLKEAFLAEVAILFPLMMRNYVGQLQQEIDIKKMISDKINSFSADELELMFEKAVGKQLQLFRLAGAVIGCTTGLVMIAITRLLAS